MDWNHPENAEFRLFVSEVRETCLGDIEAMAARAKDQGREDMLPMMRMGYRAVRDSKDPTFMDESVCELRRWAAAFVARKWDEAFKDRKVVPRTNFYATPTDAARGVTDPPSDD